MPDRAFRGVLFGRISTVIVSAAIVSTGWPGIPPTVSARVLAPPPDRLDMSIEQNSTEQLRDGDIVWVEWLTRSERGRFAQALADFDASLIWIPSMRPRCLAAA